MIADETVRRHYQQAMREKLNAFFQPQQRDGGNWRSGGGGGRNGGGFSAVAGSAAGRQTAVPAEFRTVLRARAWCEAIRMCRRCVKPCWR